MVLKYFSSPFAKAHKKAAKALLVWELGAGFTHMQNLFGVARHLRSIGVECIVATADPRFDPWFRSIGCQCLQTWLWPVMRSGIALPPQRKARVFSDVLANFGLCEPATLAGMLAHYETLFDLVQPDILLCENAFGAALAARGRIPTIIFGSTLMLLPPRLGDGFAPMDADHPEPSWPVDQILDALNAGLGERARPPLSALNDILDCEALMPFGPAAFDPYQAYRTDRILPPHCPELPEVVGSNKRRHVFVYLHEDVQRNKSVMDTILKLPAGSRIYIPALSKVWQKRLLKNGLIPQKQMLALHDIAKEATALLHQGGVTLTAAALAMGIPQIILARSKENEIAGRYVADQGLGSLTSMKAISSQSLLEEIRAVLADQEIAAKAVTASTRHRAWFSNNPTHEVACKAAEILGLSAPSCLEPAEHRLWSPV